MNSVLTKGFTFEPSSILASFAFSGVFRPAFCMQRDLLRCEIREPIGRVLLFRSPPVHAVIFPCEWRTWWGVV